MQIPGHRNTGPDFGDHGTPVDILIRMSLAVFELSLTNEKEDWYVRLANVMERAWEEGRHLSRTRYKFVRWATMAGVGYGPASDVCDRASGWISDIAHSGVDNHVAKNPAWGVAIVGDDESVNDFVLHKTFAAKMIGMAGMAIAARLGEVIAICQGQEELEAETLPCSPIDRPVGPMEDDFTKFLHAGEVHTFTPLQAGVVRRLFWLSQKPGFKGLTYKEALADLSSADSPRDVFRTSAKAGKSNGAGRDHKAWGTLIKTRHNSDKRGKLIYLDLGDPEVPG